MDSRQRLWMVVAAALLAARVHAEELVQVDPATACV
ncbi:MAG: hypothetical protein KatS3mg077_2154 [Candidatus Binatia bacterium]|nr:MAG: hypothetical protein KatS3mg077_2154 [Candidatus Binatia bacterium]